MDVKIRIMEETDINFCTSIITDLLGEPEDVSRETLKEYYEDEQEGSLMLVAEIEGKQAGFAGILIERWNMTANIEWIGVMEKFRKKKIGTKLLNELIEYAKTKKVRKIYVDTAVDNIAAISYYIKNKLPDCLIF